MDRHDLIELLYHATSKLCEGKRQRIAASIICAVVGLFVFASFGVYTWLGTKLDPKATCILLPGATILCIMSVWFYLTPDH